MEIDEEYGVYNNEVISKLNVNFIALGYVKCLECN